MIEVLKQMVEVLEWCHVGEPIGTAEAIKAGKQAIAELESQEPVAWVAEDVCEGQYIDGRPRKIWWECEKGVGTAFYAHPPQRTEPKVCCQEYDTCLEPCTPRGTHLAQRTWVGLTNEEIVKIVNANTSKGLWLMAKAIEAKLKEKNCAG
jgi:hypothetical protein